MLQIRTTYDETLPITARRAEIIKLIQDHQVVIIAGATGSGKTTQIPKMCLDAGRGQHGLIGHTQPRRIAARTVAERIAVELGTEIGNLVGFSVRFTDKVTKRTKVRIMTDGILLAEIQRDRLLRRYDTIIIDEAHERSLNVDFLLGYLKQLLPQRPDLKIIITSATIDLESFAQYFGDAPVLEVSGRTYPVEIRYRPIVDPMDPTRQDRDQIEAIIDAIRELESEPAGDVLIFLSGEREIRDTADALRDEAGSKTEILPLYARLSATDQHRIFAAHSNRRIVLATNVAETSLTVPGIKYVIDAGTARISRYSAQTKVQLLPIEPISQASANQRAGRCGRTSHGICIRLFSNEDFEKRPAFTDPEILRTNLASVILQMTAVGLGDLERFEFLQPPDRRRIADGLILLQELGAIAGPGKLTKVGRTLAVLPVDPRLGRMIIEGDQRGCLRDVLVLAAALTIADPRERPADNEAQARQQHARFADKKSDFMGYLNLWRYLRKMQQELSGNQFRRMCKSEYLNFMRVREWQDLVSQLKQVAAAQQMHVTTADGDEDQIHRSLLAGLLSQVGMADPLNMRTYSGPRGAQFHIFPGSALFKSTPRAIMAAELVDTSRLWAREVAIIDPAWIEQQAAHLVKRTYAEPHWERNRASVVASETVTLYGLPIVSGRKVQYGNVDPQLSREIFIRQALVEGDWLTRHHFFAANAHTMQTVADLENKSRRRDILIDDESLYAFYDARIPADVTSGRHFDSWWKKARHQVPDLLTATTDDLVRAGAQLPTDAEFPDVWSDGSRPLELTYQFDPESLSSQSSPTIDGISVDIPLVMLHETMPRKFDWLVPGRREELIIAMIRTLPKALRRQVVPAPDRARQILPQLDPDHDELTESVARQLRAATGAAIDADDFVLSKLPKHLQMTFRVIDEDGSVLGTGQDLSALKLSLAPVQSHVVSQRSGSLERADVRDWDFGPLPESFALVDGPTAPLGYPSLVIEADTIALRVLTSRAHRDRAMPPAINKLIRLQVPASSSKTLRALASIDRLALSSAPHLNAAALFDDCVKATVDAILGNGKIPIDRASFAEQLQLVKTGLGPKLIDTVRAVAGTLRARNGAMDALANYSNTSFDSSTADINAQLEFLFGSDFVSAHGTDKLSDIARYCDGIVVRLDRLKGHRTMDETNTAIITDVLNEFNQFVRSFSALEPVPDGVTHIRWMIEEFRLSLFAQAISTAYPVSEKRIYKAMDAF